MPRPRTPNAVADVTGASDKNPGRFKDRANPDVGPLGLPPAHLSEEAIEAWILFAGEMPWLAASDRGIVEIAAVLRARLKCDPDMGVNAMAQYRLCLSAMGGDPSSRSKVSVPDEESDDPAAEFFN